MNIYQPFVFPDKLISPVTGYNCKRITKQNIKQFGFASISELHDQYPEFPVMCSSYHSQVIQSSIKGGDTYSANNTINKLKTHEELIRLYQNNPKACHSCSCSLTFEQRLNKFCSKSCANRRPQKPQTRKKISKGIIRFNDQNPDFRKEVSLRHKTVKPLTSVSCYCCNKTLTINTETYDKRKYKFFSCDREQCKIFVRKKISSETGKKSANSRCKRSVLEIKLYELCKKRYDVSHNEIIINGWDADIIFYQYKIAVLWNGPWHYKNMNMTNHSLDQVVTRDCLKISALENLGWTVLVYQDNQWTPETAFVDIILKINQL